MIQSGKSLLNEEFRVDNAKATGASSKASSRPITPTISLGRLMLTTP